MAGLERAAEAGQVERVDACSASAERGGGVEEATTWSRRGRAGAACPGLRPSSASRSAARPTGTLWMRSSGGRPLGRRNRPSKPTARSRSPRAYRRRWRERLDAGELALAQLQPGLGVGADHDVGLAAARAGAHARADRGAAHLPAAADVAEADVVGGVEARLRAEVAGRERAERLRHTRRKVVHPRQPTQRARWIRSRACPTSRSTTPEPAPCSRLRRATRRKVGIYACGPTVYARVHVGNARPFVVFSPAQALPRARGLRRDAGRQRHRHQRQDLRRGAKPRARRRRSWRRRWPRHYIAGHRPARARAARRGAATRPSTSARSSR